METKGTYKLYELSDRLSEIQDILYNLEGVDIPADLHQDYLKFSKLFILSNRPIID